MKAGATATVEDEPTTEVSALVNKIDELLEKFIGIRDLDLSTTMHKLALTATEVRMTCISACVQHSLAVSLKSLLACSTATFKTSSSLTTLCWMCVV